MTDSEDMTLQPEQEPFQDVRDLIEDIQEACPDDGYIFRGEPREYKKVSSGIYRFSEDLGVTLGDSFRPMDMERVYVERVKRLGHYSPGTSNVEILTDLRHYGGPTTLIDFSHSMLVALFFACNGEPDKDGRLIILSTEGISTLTEIDYSKDRKKIAMLTPARTQHSRARVDVQSSVFVHAPKGFIGESTFTSIKIPWELKTECKIYLQRYHNIHDQTVYNDLIGYIENEKTYQKAMVFFSRGLAKGRGSDGEDISDQALRIDISSLTNRPDDFTGWMQLKPDSTDALFRYSDNKKTRDQYGDAITDFDKALQIRPDFADALFYQGKAKLAVGEHEGAVKDFNQAIDLDRNNAGAWINRGIAKGLLGRYEEAIADYDEALRLEPKNAEAWFNRGVAKGQLGQHEEAIFDFGEALRLAPDNAGAWSNRGIAKENLGRYEEAIADYDEAIKL
ncbi:MAG: tetratricopeptide repeat protein, partial [Hyphomonadaceae bacterium]|nr:tetratricopeptide repeat protein [Hyphomonadaceae bacterium]